MPKITMLTKCLLFFNIAWAAGQVFPIDNHVISEPDIECHSSTVSLNFVTRNPFQGHVFVRGHRREDSCHKDYVLNRDNGGFLHIPFETCGMRRQRMASPRGLAISATVVISFHRAFITSVDKAYHIKCFYMEEDIKVSHGLTVSMLPTTDLGLTPPMPTCSYKVLSGGPNGRPVRYAKVGENVYHKWSCEYEMADMYCMIVHSCTVDDGEKSVYEVIDSDGCAKDPVILEDLRYGNDLMAGTDASVFKFADKPHVYFACQIALTMKHEHGGACPRPRCGAAATNRIRRFKRASITDYRVVEKRHRDFGGDDFDLQAQPILVVDLDDDLNLPNIGNEPFLSRIYDLSSLNRTVSSDISQTGICLSSTVFGTVIGAIILACLVAIVIMVTAVLRHKANGKL